MLMTIMQISTSLTPSTRNSLAELWRRTCGTLTSRPIGLATRAWRMMNWWCRMITIRNKEETIMILPQCNTMLRCSQHLCDLPQTKNWFNILINSPMEHVSARQDSIRSVIVWEVTKSWHRCKDWIRIRLQGKTLKRKCPWRHLLLLMIMVH